MSGTSTEGKYFARAMQADVVIIGAGLAGLAYAVFVYRHARS